MGFEVQGLGGWDVGIRQRLVVAMQGFGFMVSGKGR